MIPAFGLAVLFFCGCVLLHLLLTRLTRGAAFVRNGYLFIVAMGALAAVVIVPRGWQFAATFYLVAVILWNLYMTFFINLMNSVSLRMMVEIDHAPAQSLSNEELLGRYSDEAALESRLQEMVAGGLLQVEADQLVLTGKGRRLATVLILIRRAFGIEFFG